MAIKKAEKRNPFDKCKFSIGTTELIEVLDMTKSGTSLYSFLIENGTKFLSLDGIAYINPVELTQFLTWTRKSVYNGIDQLLDKNILSQTGRPGEYYYNPKFFPDGIGNQKN